MPDQARYLTPQVRADLVRKMVFVAGPRQVGKTTLALSLPGGRSAYLNWDIAEHRERILRGQLPPAKLWVFDEIHKYRRWRNYLKGVYDGRRPGQRVLVTGSGRLDLYRFGGDSLQGRYHLLRLHPFSARELNLTSAGDLSDLLNLGGFPEPFLGGSLVEARRWSREYRTRLIRDDVASLERIQDLGHLELLMLRLPELVGSPLSINSLRDLSRAAVWGTSHPCGEEGAEALSPRLVDRAGKPGQVREPRGLPLLEMGALPAGYPGPGCQIAVLPRHGRPRGGLRHRRAPGAAADGGVQVG
jgi:hypothetical protein